ncbi:sodium-coupled monocarboxylate transporter 1-like [Hetaerina americana]|uniref:sodium-coupled monocarboxylate transporter 1-like n=1 Tax=Hetaerina americana TaxID=62018 RepID=UPI003A7F1B4D
MEVVSIRVPLTPCSTIQGVHVGLPLSAHGVILKYTSSPFWPSPTVTVGVDNAPRTVDVLRHFGWEDHLVFSVMLAASALIGVFFACHGGRQRTAEEFLVGDRKMGVLPIAMSLTASFTSGIMLLGIPLEIYRYGTQQFLVLFGCVGATVTITFIYMPIFYDLRLTSSYELLYLPIVLYGPALVYNQVTGFSVSLIMPIVSIVCIFYTTVGGLKAVVWTDTLQMCLVYVALMFSAVKSTLEIGGADVIWQRGWEGDRMELFKWVLRCMDLNPTTRHTFWTTLFGGYLYCLSGVSNHQALIQRYVSLPSKEKARSALLLYAFGVIVLVSFLTYLGLAAYALYHDCDPITSQRIENPDQLLPYLVMDTSGRVAGIPGLFVAGMFSAALSSVSTGLNSLAATTFEDFIKGVVFPKREFSQTSSATILKCVAFAYGAACVGLTYVVAQLGALLQIAMSLISMTSGPMFGIFNLGLLVPWANAKGTMVGGVAGMVCSGVVVVGAQVYAFLGRISHPTLELSTRGCPAGGNASTAMDRTLAGHEDGFPVEGGAEVFALFRLSYMYYAALGCFTTMLVGAACSRLTGGQPLERLDPKLVAPFMRRFLPPASSKGGRRTAMVGDGEDLPKEAQGLLGNAEHLIVITPAEKEQKPAADLEELLLSDPAVGLLEKEETISLPLLCRRRNELQVRGGGEHTLNPSPVGAPPLLLLALGCSGR